MKSALLIPGYACRSWIWDSSIKKLKPSLSFKSIDWPTELTYAFSKLSDFTNWFANNHLKTTKQYDFLIGHSMGGIIAILASLEATFKIDQLILVESFVKPPVPFFQNILMNNAPDKIIGKVEKMLNDERKNIMTR